MEAKLSSPLFIAEGPMNEEQPPLYRCGLSIRKVEWRSSWISELQRPYLNMLLGPLLTSRSVKAESLESWSPLDQVRMWQGRLPW